MPDKWARDLIRVFGDFSATRGLTLKTRSKRDQHEHSGSSRSPGSLQTLNDAPHLFDHDFNNPAVC